MKRRKIAEQWYSWDIPQGRAGIRCHFKGDWGYYFRSHNGNEIGENEYRAKSYREALAMVTIFANTR